MKYELINPSDKIYFEGDFPLVAMGYAITLLGEVFMGYGEYLGDFPHPRLTEEWAQRAETHPDLNPEERVAMAAWIRAHEFRFGKNPKIRLDDGREVWGCECWWGPAEDFKANGYAKEYGVEV